MKIKYELTHVPNSLSPVYLDKIVDGDIYFITRFGKWTDYGKAPLANVLSIDNKAKTLYILDRSYFRIVMGVFSV